MEKTQRLGKYRVIGLLATGGMGEVFLARQEGPAGFAKTVVVKKILRHLAFDQSFIDMFLNEARLAALLSHHNIVQIFELGQEDDTWFIAMEYVHGRSLRAIKQRLLERREVVSPSLAARLCAQALLGLHFAHGLSDELGQKLNIVHRDISPDNVLVSFAGVVKLVDFGIAKATNSGQSTRTGTLKGKYAYMAPEQLKGSGKTDARTDIYSMGVLLYEMLTGSRPFEAENEAAIISAVLGTPPQPVSERNPDVPEAMNTLVMKALAKDPEERFGSAEEMSLALDAFIQQSGEVITDAHIGQFLRDLFGADAVQSNPSLGAFVPTGGGPMPSAGTQVLTGAKPVQPSSAPRAPVAPARRKRLPLALGVAAVVLVPAGVLFAFRNSAQTPGATFVPAQEATAPAPQVGRPVPGVTPDVVDRPSAVSVVEPEPVAPPVVVAPRPVRSASTQTRRAPPQRNGKVTVRVNPYAEVFYAGKSLGITPIPAVEVPAGLASFTLKNKQLGVTRKVSVKVPAGGEVVLKADLFDKTAKTER